MRSTVGGLGFPRSFLGLLVISFILASFPFATALLYSAWNTDRLAQPNTNAVFNAAQAARASRSLVNVSTRSRASFSKTWCFLRAA